MIVKCPECSVGFNLDDSKVPDDGAWVRCSKCQHVFEVKPLPKPPKAPEDKVELDADAAAMPQEPEPSPEPETPPEPAARPEPEEPEVDLGAELGTAEAAGRGGLFRVVFWLVGLLLLAALVGIGGLLVMDRMGLGGDIVASARKLPVVGAILEMVKVSPPKETPAERATKMALAGVRGYFRINEKAGRIFVIQGQVDNNHAKPQRAIRVRGRLHDLKGKVVRSEVVYAGVSFTADQLRQLTPDDMKSKLAQPVGPDGSPYVAQPGKSLPFMIIFTDLPGNLTEFTAEVVGSEVYQPKAGPAR